MIKNEVNFNISDEAVSGAITGINNARTSIAEFLIAGLAPEERQRLFKMGKDSVQYVDSNYDYAQDEDLRSAEISLPVWNNDITTTKQLLKVLNVLEPLYFDVLDMMMIAGSEAMEQAQKNYRFVRYKAAEGQPKARTAYETLKELRWNRQEKQNGTPQP